MKVREREDKAHRRVRDKSREKMRNTCLNRDKQPYIHESRTMPVLNEQDVRMKSEVQTEQVSIKSFVCVQDLKIRSKVQLNQKVDRADECRLKKSKDSPRKPVVPIELPASLVQSINSSVIKDLPSSPPVLDRSNKQLSSKMLQNIDECLNDEVPQIDSCAKFSPFLKADDEDNFAMQRNVNDMLYGDLNNIVEYAKGIEK